MTRFDYDAFEYPYNGDDLEDIYDEYNYDDDYYEYDDEEDYEDDIFDYNDYDEDEDEDK